MNTIISMDNMKKVFFVIYLFLVPVSVSNAFIGDITLFRFHSNSFSPSYLRALELNHDFTFRYYMFALDTIDTCSIEVCGSVSGYWKQHKDSIFLMSYHYYELSPIGKQLSGLFVTQNCEFKDSICFRIVDEQCLRPAKNSYGSLCPWNSIEIPDSIRNMFIPLIEMLNLNY